MRYFSYNVPTMREDGEVIDNEIKTVSEDDIRTEYFPQWEQLMIKKYGKDHYNETFCFLDCVDDFIVVNWAWEVKE